MNTKTLAILATTHLSVFLFATLFYCFSDVGRSMVHSAESWTTPVVAAAAFSERITEDEKAINERMKSPEIQEICKAQAEYAVLLDEAIRIEKEKTTNDASRSATIELIQEKTKAMTNPKFEALKSVKEEAKIIMGVK